MCTLVTAFQSVPGAPLVVAANRDELLTRPAAGPRRWTGEDFFAPRDEQKGGTWLGLTRSGMFVGVTNRFGAPADLGRSSRGELVVEALRAPNARTLHAALKDLSPTRYNAFHLLYADATAAFVTWSDGAQLTQTELAPGLHIVTERSLGGDDRARTERVRSAWQAEVAVALRSPSRLESQGIHALQGLMRLHAEDPVGGTCVHTSLGYGTRSSLVLALPQAPNSAVFHWAEGHPCQHPYQDFSDPIRALLA